MDRDDPEKRIADLEHQLAERKRAAELERQLAERNAAARGHGQPPPFTATHAGARWYPPGYPGQAVPSGQAGLGRQPQWRTLAPWVILGFVILVMFSGVAAFGLTLIVDPSSAQWTGGILCDSGYHLEGREQAGTILPAMQYNTPSSTTAYSALFTCVNGHNEYALSDSGPVVGLQALAIMIVVGLPLLAVAAVWALIRRLRRKPG
jgi:hypothetical protein